MEEHVDDGYTGTQQLNPDRIVQHVWGLRYIDDLVLNRVDANANGSYTDSSDFTHYALTDHQFSVIAMIDGGANLIERVSYTPYGEARHHWKQDVDGDGDIDATDQSAVTAALNNRIYESGYNVDADFDRNGIIDSNDSRQIGSGAFRAALPVVPVDQRRVTRLCMHDSAPSSASNGPPCPDVEQEPITQGFSHTKPDVAMCSGRS